VRIWKFFLWGHQTVTEEPKKRVLSTEDKARITDRCHKRISRFCQRRGIAFDKEKYRECVERENKLFFAGKKPRHRQKREMSEDEIQRLREKMASDQEEMDDELFDDEMIRSLNRIYADPDKELRREEENKKLKKWVEEEYGYYA
jgi:hypothetical protein